jgi:hypothetical protein
MVAESAQDNVKGVLFQPHQPRTILGGGAKQQHSNSRGLNRPQFHRPAPSPSRHIQQVSSQSVQIPKANGSSLNDMLTVVARIFQQIMTESNGAESEEDRIVVITKTVLKLVKQNGR